MRFARLFLLSALGLFPAVAMAQTDLDNSYPDGLTVSFQAMHAAIAAGFYDAASTRYRRMSVQDRFVMDLVVCGWLSSRNSRGVYTAFYPFGYRVKTGAAYVGVNYLNPAHGAQTRQALADFGCPEAALGL